MNPHRTCTFNSQLHVLARTKRPRLKPVECDTQGNSYSLGHYPTTCSHVSEEFHRLGQDEAEQRKKRAR